MKIAEAYFYPPWLVPHTLTITQKYGLYCGEGQPKTHEDAIAQVNRRRARKGLPPLGNKPPGQQKVTTV